MKRLLSTLVAVIAATWIARADGETNETATASSRKRLSLNASADVETAYLCRGFVWDKHPIATQYLDLDFDSGVAGRFGAYVWDMLAKSPASHADGQSYRLNEIDYGLRYAYDLELAKDWTLVSGAAKQWVTFPGREHRGSNSVIDWQAFQSLRNPYLVPYWKMRYIYKPFHEFYWIFGVKRSFPLFADGLELTLDFFGDLGDARHCRNIFGPKPHDPSSNYHGGIQSLNFVVRLDYAVTDWLNVFAFVGEYSLVDEAGRRTVKARRDIDGIRDLAYGGCVLSLSF